MLSARCWLQHEMRPWPMMYTYLHLLAVKRSTYLYRVDSKDHNFISCSFAGDNKKQHPI